MKILVTTTNSFLLVDLETRQCTILHQGSGVYYGIANSDSKVFISCRNQTNCYSDDPNTPETPELLVFDNHLNLLDSISPDIPLQDLHGSLHLDDKVWITATGDNSIAKYSLSDKCWESWYPLPLTAERHSDVNHFNTIEIIGDSLYVVAHNKGPSAIIEYSYPELKLKSTYLLGEHAHNVWKDASSNLWTCDSANGHLISTNDNYIRTGGFPRGVINTNSRLIVGVSALAPREVRASQDGCIRIYSLDGLLQSEMLLKEAGMVLDIRAVPETCILDNVINNHTMYLKDNIDSLMMDYIVMAEPRTSKYLPLHHWHKQEEYRWSASELSNILLKLNPDETKITLVLASGFPGKYSVRFSGLGMKPVTVEFNEPENREITLTVDPTNVDKHLKIKVPFLWVPNEHSQESEDSRRLGIAIKSIKIVRESTETDA